MNIKDCLECLDWYFYNSMGGGYKAEKPKEHYKYLKETIENMLKEEKVDDYDIDEGDLVMDEEKKCKYCKHWNKLSTEEPCVGCYDGNYYEPIEDEEETSMKNEKTGINSPWITYVNQVKCLFADDTDVTYRYNDDRKELILWVADLKRADALARLIPTEKDFGGVKLYISVLPDNQEKVPFAELVEKAMDGNPHFSQLIKVPMQDGKSFNYLMFEPEVAQYWNDNLADPHGNVSTVYADLAQDVFGVVPGTFFATDC